MIYFYTTMIEHYQQRIEDKSIPILVRAQFKLTIAYYQSELNKISTPNIHSKLFLPC